jgi:LuxR family transcriptional regulator of csgAB operon
MGLMDLPMLIHHSEGGKMKEDTNTLDERLIYIIGPLKSQNLLMCSFLGQTTGVECLTAENLDDVQMAENGNASERRLFLWDCFGKDLEGCLFELDASFLPLASKSLLGLFNVRADWGIEEATLSQGIRGFFYQEDSLEQLRKGILAIFNGELWISRMLLSKCILNSNSHKSHPRGKKRVLTTREIEILSVIASGESNQTIAERLCISHHTVKTHIYNIYRKINVPNRLQAALWAIENL